MVGVLLGRVAGELVGDLRHTLLIVVGGAAFAGGRLPDSDRRDGTCGRDDRVRRSVALALVAIAVARGLAGSVSVSAAQRARRM
jgi:hypothetical protein